MFRLQRSQDIDGAIKQIKAFRDDVSKGKSSEELDRLYPKPLEGAVGEPKYVMARAGANLGIKPPLIRKPNISTYELNPDYLDLIDAVLSNEPQFREQLDPESWFRDYGRWVELDEEIVSPAQGADIEINLRETHPEVAEDDQILREIEASVALGVRNFLPYRASSYKQDHLRVVYRSKTCQL